MSELGSEEPWEDFEKCKTWQASSRPKCNSLPFKRCKLFSHYLWCLFSGNKMLDYIIDHQRGGATVFSSSLTLPQKFYKLSLMNMVMTMMMMMMMMMMVRVTMTMMMIMMVLPQKFPRLSLDCTILLQHCRWLPPPRPKNMFTNIHKLSTNSRNMFVQIFINFHKYS